MKNPESIAFAEALQNFAIRNGESVYAICKKANVPGATYQSWKQGKCNVTPTMRARLLRAFPKLPSGHVEKPLLKKEEHAPKKDHSTVTIKLNVLVDLLSIMKDPALVNSVVELSDWARREDTTLGDVLRILQQA